MSSNIPLNTSINNPTTWHPTGWHPMNDKTRSWSDQRLRVLQHGMMAAGIQPLSRPATECGAVTGSGYSTRYCMALKAQALALLEIGIHEYFVSQKLGIPERTLRNIRKTAMDRGWDPEKDPRILDSYVETRKSCGRPRKVARDVETQQDSNVSEDKA